MSIDNGLRELRQAYWSDLRDTADDIRGDCIDGTIADREALDQRVWETCDGSAWVIYTQQAQIVLLCSDNCDAGPDELGADGFDFSSGMLWSQLAFHAMRADLIEQLEALGIDVNADDLGIGDDDDDDDDDDEPERTRYRNGDEINLTHCGCDGCSPAMVNGVLCHESGCPDAWRDHPADCAECGCGFYRESRHQSHCPDCIAA